MKELTHDKKLEALDFVEKSLEEPEKLKCKPYICTIFLYSIDVTLGKYSFEEIQYLFPELHKAVEKKKIEVTGEPSTLFKTIWPEEFNQKRIELIKQVRSELMDDGQPF